MQFFHWLWSNIFVAIFILKISFHLFHFFLLYIYKPMLTEMSLQREIPKEYFYIKIVFSLMYTHILSAFLSHTHTHTAAHTYVTFWHIIEAGSISTTCCWKCWWYWIIYSIFYTLQNRFGYFDTFWSLPYGYFMVAELPDAQVLWQS